MKTNIFYLLVIIFIYCSCDKNSEVKTLNKKDLLHSWELDYYINKSTGETQNLPDTYSAGITFHGEDCVNVLGPCNGGPGKYELIDNKIKVTKLAMTERGCNILGYETLFTGNLSGTYIISGEKLTIDSDNDYNLVFSRMDSTKVYDCYDF